MNIEGTDATGYVYRQAKRRDRAKSSRLAGKEITTKSDTKKQKASQVAKEKLPKASPHEQPKKALKKREREEAPEEKYLGEIRELVLDPARHDEIESYMAIVAKNGDLNDQPVLQAIVERYHQLANLPGFEKQPMTPRERLQIAYQIEVEVPKVKSVAKDRFISSKPKRPLKSIAPPRDMIITKKGRIILLAKPEESLLASKGTWKEVHSAVKLYAVGSEVLSKKTVIIKTVKTVTPQVQAVIPLADKGEARVVEQEMLYYRRFREKQIPGIAKLRVFMDITGKKPEQEDYVRHLKPLEDEPFVYYRVGIFDRYDGSLDNKRDLSLDATIQVMRDVSETIGAIHEDGVIHGDLKLGNILYRENPDGTVKVGVTDFGLSFEDKGKETEFPEVSYSSGSYGTNFATAPELINNKDFKGNVYKTEVWALGITFLELTTKKDAPWRELIPKNFNDLSEKQKIAIMRKVNTQVANFGQLCISRARELENQQHLSKDEQVELLVCKMLHLDPAKRIGMQEVQRVLAGIA